MSLRNLVNFERLLYLVKLVMVDSNFTKYDVRVLVAADCFIEGSNVTAPRHGIWIPE